MATLQEVLLCGAFPACQILGLVLLGLVFRVDRGKDGGR